MDEKKVREAIEKVEMFPVWNMNDRWLKTNDMQELTKIITEALEKQLPMKPEMRTAYNDFGGRLICYKGFCPSCGGVVESYRNGSCHHCTNMECVTGV